jgi:hypothetical protein
VFAAEGYGHGSALEAYSTFLELRISFMILMIYLSPVISGKNLKVPSGRIPAGIYASIIVDSRRRWKSAIGVLSSDESVAWGDTVIL